MLPQMVKRILPAMGNEVITLVKDTALAQTIGVAELFHPDDVLVEVDAVAVLPPDA